MANNENTNVATEESLQVVAFKLRNEEYGVSILNVQEIRNLTDITRVPFAQDFIKGVINLRGSVLPVIDLKERLGLEETPYTQDTRIVTVTVGDLHVGMLVDAVTEVLTLTAKPIDAKKAINGKELTRFLSGIGNIDGRLIIMLNLEEIIGLPKEGK
ncbi:MAG: chemotaxis protein CheW [Selenomonadaceae bacterium]|jgi:purine-binding chemotaxis protein CheW|uniref:chemotaxis protein CheW n=1 Tax=Selenomonas bovis TaxID=416586 RepID=UPI0004E1DEB8|nr:chemotaxis protein CheW [Selenomonas bovis]MBQ1622849.1 chemotaxis protein CheW [Selenomonas sp.]MCI6751484.1 chemotaxis protein CheW [Selenomonas bovis]MDY6272307.1 chemotaxis protein CheW [Selenomonadaceae bacterium]MDY6298745.1 chemotaxis protein CheW [Selenomonadaceae bacterium]